MSEREDKMVMRLFMMNNLERAKLDVSAYTHTGILVNITFSVCFGSLKISVG